MGPWDWAQPVSAFPLRHSATLLESFLMRNQLVRYCRARSGQGRGLECTHILAGLPLRRETLVLAEPNDRMGWVSLALGMAKQGRMIA